MNTKMSSSESIRRYRGEILGQSGGVQDIQPFLGRSDVAMLVNNAGNVPVTISRPCLVNDNRARLNTERAELTFGERDRRPILVRFHLSQ
jgi:hypothetical protein